MMKDVRENCAKLNNDRLYYLLCGGVSAICLAGLFAMLFSWLNEQNNISSLSVIAAVVSVLLFGAVGVIFVFKWFREFGDASKKKIDGLSVVQRTSKNDRVTAIIIFAGLILVGLSVLVLVWLLQLVNGSNISFGDSLDIWAKLDSQHYIHIAEHWYAYGGTEETLGNDVRLVFLPGYPVIMKAVRLLSFNLLGYFEAGMVASMLLFAGSGSMLYLLMRLDYEKEEALRAVKFLCLIPGAFFFIAPMSESLFLFTTLASIYFARKGNLPSASLFGFYAAFTRSLGVLVLVPVVYELILKTIEEKPKGKNAILKRIGDFASTALIPCGLLVYLWVNYSVTGNAFKFLEYQKNHWGQQISYFFNTASYQAREFVKYIDNGRVSVAFALWGMGMCALFGSLIILIAGSKKIRTSYLGYSMVYYVIAMGATWLLSAPRYAAGLFALPVSLALITKKKAAEDIITVLLVAVYVIYGFMFINRWQVW